MEKICVRCDCSLVKINVITSRNTFHITKESQNTILTKLEKIQGYVCKKCGEVSFFVENEDFLGEIEQGF